MKILIAIFILFLHQASYGQFTDDILESYRKKIQMASESKDPDVAVDLLSEVIVQGFPIGDCATPDSQTNARNQILAQSLELLNRYPNRISRQESLINTALLDCGNADTPENELLARKSLKRLSERFLHVYFYISDHLTNKDILPPLKRILENHDQLAKSGDVSSDEFEHFRDNIHGVLSWSQMSLIEDCDKWTLDQWRKWLDEQVKDSP